jgi:hypothetical protein
MGGLELLGGGLARVRRLECRRRRLRRVVCVSVTLVSGGWERNEETRE